MIKIFLILLLTLKFLGTAHASFMPKAEGWELAPGAPKVISRDTFLREFDIRVTALTLQQSNPLLLAAGMEKGLRDTLPTAENGLAARAIVYKTRTEAALDIMGAEAEMDKLIALGPPGLVSRLHALASAFNAHKHEPLVKSALDQLKALFYSDWNGFRTSIILKDLREKGTVDLSR